MNAKKFSDAMSELDTKYVDEALNYKKKAKKPIWVKWGAMAACLCLIVVAIITIPSMLSPQDSDGGGGGIIADAPPMIYVNDTLYKQSTKQTSYNELKDDFVYIGIIESDITNFQGTDNMGNYLDGIPKENFQANHPIVGAKVYQYGDNIVVEIKGKYWLYEKVLQEAPTIFAEQSVVDAIEQDITDQDIESWTETANAIFDLEYVIPIYSTANATKDSLAILETLAFDNQYMIPVMSNGKCIGTATIAQQESKWVIAVYEHGFDLKTEMDKNKGTATCLVDVVQLNERGFLISADTEEFVAISGFGISDNMSGQELLNRILNNTDTTNNTEG